MGFVPGYSCGGSGGFSPPSLCPTQENNFSNFMGVWKGGENIYNFSMKIGVFGVGYVGLTTALGFASKGHLVFAVDKDEAKIELLKQGKVPYFEPGAQEFLERYGERLEFSTDPALVVREADVIFICVGTPSLPDGSADLSQVEEVARFIAEEMQDYKLIVEKSTVPVHTAYWIKRIINLYRKKDVPFDVVSNPEFLKEGTALSDFLHPHRIVIGAETQRAKDIMGQLYRDFKAPIIFTDVKTAEIIKHASNSFLAAKISFINMVADLCEAVGADVEMVAEGMGLDPRIGKEFLKAGVGFGGSCFPKDIKAFYKIAEENQVDFSLLKEVERINQQRPVKFLKKIKGVIWNLKGKTIGILGLSFKPNTDDVREAPSLKIINLLLEEGAQVKAYDPVAGGNAKKVIPSLQLSPDPYSLAQGTNALALITEWEEFKNLDWKKIKEFMETPIIFDGRNFLEGKKLVSLGFEYYPVGKPPLGKRNG